MNTISDELFARLEQQEKDLAKWRIRENVAAVVPAKPKHKRVTKTRKTRT